MQQLKRLGYRLMPAWLVQQMRVRMWRRLFWQDPDEPEVAVLSRFVKPKDTVIDLGANLGAYTRLLAECVGPEGHVYSFEPVPYTFSALESNIKRANLSQVHLMPYAATSEACVLKMQIPRFDTGGESYYEAEIVETADPALTTYEVQGKPLDSMLPHDVNVSFIKCDVEGHELAAFQGAVQLLERSKPVCLVEIKGEEHIAQMSSFMGQFGYRCYVLEGDQLTERHGRSDWLNYFFMTEAGQG